MAANKEEEDDVALAPEFHVGDATNLTEFVDKNSVDLVVTSPPYPMIAMWDGLIGPASETDADATKLTGMEVFELMHKHLDGVWKQLYEVTKPGAIVAINIGDAMRTYDKDFQMFPNGARTTMGMCEAGFSPLPNIYWKKPTNRPVAFLGSGYLPVNAYVSFECEHILIFRHGGPRKFAPGDPNREASKFTVEERNAWFTQIWEVPGVRQEVVAGRRNAAFPPEIPRRLIRMFSVFGDTVLDPFVGTGTTAIVATENGRRAIGIDKDEEFIKYAKRRAFGDPNQAKITTFFKRG